MAHVISGFTMFLKNAACINWLIGHELLGNDTCSHIYMYCEAIKYVRKYQTVIYVSLIFKHKYNALVDMCISLIERNVATKLTEFY